MKSISITLLLLFLLTSVSFSQQQPLFSEKTVEIKGRVFLPYTKGEVVRKIVGNQKPLLDKICSIITAWDSIVTPRGLQVYCSGFDNSLDIYFLPYLYEDGVRFASEGGPSVSFYVNDPSQMLGTAIVSDIFLCPQKTADFHGYPIYRNNHQEVTIVSKEKLPLFIPVSQEELLKALIAKEEKNAQKTSGSDYQTTLREMEQFYQKLLKTDKEAAVEFKQGIEEFKAEINKSGKETIDMVALLKKELSSLTIKERSMQAYYGGTGAMEEYHNASGLVPFENRENADALVRPNPSLIKYSSKDKIQLLIICWSVGEDVNLDKPRLYNEGRDGFHLVDNLMSELYKSQKTWSNIFDICDR